MKQYFRLQSKMEIKGAWYLNDIVDEQGQEILASHFNQGKVFDSAKQLTVLLNVVGNPVDFRLTTFASPIVSNAFADIVESFDPQAIQRIPVTVAPSTTGYEILNILTMLKCLDYEHTKIEYYTDKDSIPELVGQIEAIWNITIKPEIAEGHHIFRLAEWWVIIVVSEDLKRALEEKGFTGMKFIPLDKIYS